MLFYNLLVIYNIIIIKNSTFILYNLKLNI